MPGDGDRRQRAIGLGDDVTCTINSNDKKPQLKLVKNVENDDGGSRAESEWTLTANGGAAGTLSGLGAAGGTDVVSGTGFKAGTDALSGAAVKDDPQWLELQEERCGDVHGCYIDHARYR